MSGFPAPLEYPVDSPFWDGAREGRLRIQRCAECDHAPYPPRVRCPACFGRLEWADASGAGTVYAYGVVHRPNHPEIFDERAPFLLAVVELEEGPRLVTNLVDCDPDAVAVGDDVVVGFEEVDEDLVLPVFRPVE